MRAVLLFLILSCCGNLHAQSGEFRVHRNGLIYSDTTMRQLHQIVDSLNLKFKACDAWKTYYGVSQARGHYISLDTGDVTGAYEDLKRNIALSEFRRKYPAARLRENCLVIRSLDTHDWGEKKGQRYLSMRNFRFSGYGNDAIELADTGLMAIDFKDRYACEYSAKTADRGASLQAFYFPEGFQSPVLNPAYALMVQYVDCMVDTGKQVFLEHASVESIWNSDRGRHMAQGPGIRALDSFMLATMLGWRKHAKPEPYDSSWQLILAREEVSPRKMDRLAKTPYFRSLLADASREAMMIEEPNMDLEYLCSKYGDPKTTLHLMRCRQVTGGCSMDLSPRYHALGIARLAAETVNWEIFLRAHLDIMNDNFQRVSDGSYAWAGRQTYLRELEELDFDVESLLIGTSLRISNPGSEHYMGSISRIGRALAEYRKKEALEARLLAMISDPQLDNYNRVLMYYLYKNYQDNRDMATASGEKADRGEPAAKFKPDSKLVAACETLPDYIRTAIVSSEKR